MDRLDIHSPRFWIEMAYMILELFMGHTRHGSVLGLVSSVLSVILKKKPQNTEKENSK